MLIDISIENFMSISEKVTLSLEASSGNKLKNNLIEINDKRLLNSVVIYGANASGKSNILKAFNFIKALVVNSAKHNEGDKILWNYYKLDQEYEKKPTKFEINFIHDKIRYYYMFSFNCDKIIDEELYYYPNKRPSLIFQRKNTYDYKFTKDSEVQERNKKQTLSNTLYLSRATQLNYEGTKKAYEWFKEKVAVNFIHGNQSWLNFTINQLAENNEMKKEIETLLKRADFGINSIKVKKEKRKTVNFNFKLSDTEPTISRNKEDVEITEPYFNHTKKTKDGIKTIDFRLEEESMGTIKTLELLGPFIDVLNKGMILFYDEFEASLHPEITRFLIKYFYKKNTLGAQLIITAHDTNLLKDDLFRKDQVYFTEKTKNNNTILYSLLDYDIRENLDFEKSYLNGRFGALPILDNTLVN